MKKSKFLKKSLAMLLALMLVVAMIPLSASAAETPVITQITVNDVVATGSGSNYTAEISDPSAGDVKVAVTLKDGVGSINKGTEDTGKNQYVITLSTEEKDAKSVSFDVYDADGEKTQSVTVTYTITAKNTDTSVKSVSVDGMYDVSNVGNDYTIVVPYDNSASSADVKVALNSDKAQVNALTAVNGVFTISAVSYDTKTAFTVTAESGNKTVYSVTLVSAKAFTEFSVAGERKAASINRVTEDYDVAKTVDVHMPYGTVADSNNSYKFTPTFTKAYEGVKITATYDGVETEIVSGTEYDLAKFDGVSLTKDTSINDTTVTLKVTYSEGKTEDWTLSFDVPTQDPVAAIKGLSVGSYAATIEGTNITLTLPKSVRDSATTISLTASTGTVIDLVGTDVTGTASSDAATLTVTAGDLSKKDTFYLRVTAAGKEDNAASNQVVDYTLTVKTAAVENAKLNTMTLEDSKGNQYEASIDHSKGTVTFEVPYAVKEKADVENWKLFYTISSGSTVTELSTSGTKLGASENFIPAGDPTDGFTGANATATTSIVVTTPDLDSKTYTIVFKNAAAKTNSTLGTVELTSVDEFDKMNDSNTIKASVSGKKITVNVPFSQWTGFKQAYVATTLPEGANLYYVDTDGKLQSIDVLNEDATAAGTQLPDAETTHYEKNDASYEALKLVVASEALTVEAGTTTLTQVQANTNSGKYSIYELTLVKEAARPSAELTGFSVYDATSKKNVKGSINGTNIEITLPYYFDETKAAQNADLYLDFTVKGGESVVVDNQNGDLVGGNVSPLTFKKDGTVDTASSTSIILHPTGTLQLTSGAKSFSVLKVTSEDTNTTVPYTLTVKVADANTEAKLNSVSIKGVTATPDANNKVSIVLPFGAEVTSLVPTFNVSTNAYVKCNGTVVKAGDSFNFLSDKTFVVYSENGVNTATYTVSVTTADQFSDVNEGDWYYSNVMRAVELGILSGYSDGTFRPMNNITRRDFAIMLAQSLGHSNDEPATSPFKDVADDDYGVSSIAYLYEQGITAGDDKGNFNPDAYITRQEAAIFLARAFEATGTTSETFTDDAKIASWAKDFVYAAKAAGLMNGDTNGTFRPTSTLTRAEAASAMVNAVDN